MGQQKLPGSHAARGLPYTSWFNPITREQRIINPDNNPNNGQPGTQPGIKPFPQISAMMPVGQSGNLPPTQYFPPSDAGGTTSATTPHTAPDG
eukprot:2741504-Karenia_brevis.AAC.1